MKNINIPLSIKRGKNNKKKIRLVAVLTLLLILTESYTYTLTLKRHKEEVYNKLNIEFKEVRRIEYGTPNYNPMDLVKKVSYGKIIDYTEEIDTNTLGTKKVVFTIEEEDIVKKLEVDTEVVDTISPEISFYNENITIEKGNNYDVYSNIQAINDNVDGNIENYNLETSLDINTPGDYEVLVKAKDSSENESEKRYYITVKAPKPVMPKVYSNVAPTIDTSSVVNAALSYVGYNYTYGGASPETGFDCSGFTHYIFGLFGKEVSRSARDIAYNGTSVPQNEMIPGDIILWGNSSGITHAAIYIGNGQMVHAANPRQGVRVDNVNGWGGGLYIIMVKRI